MAGECDDCVACGDVALCWGYAYKSGVEGGYFVAWEG